MPYGTQYEVTLSKDKDITVYCIMQNSQKNPLVCNDNGKNLYMFPLGNLCIWVCN